MASHRQVSRSAAALGAVVLLGLLTSSAQAATVTAFDWGSPAAGRATCVFYTDVPFAGCRIDFRDVTAGTGWATVKMIPGGGTSGAAVRNGIPSGDSVQWRLVIRWVPGGPPSIYYSNIYPVL